MVGISSEAWKETLDVLDLGAMAGSLRTVEDAGPEQLAPGLAAVVAAEDHERWSMIERAAIDSVAPGAYLVLRNEVGRRRRPLSEDLTDLWIRRIAALLGAGFTLHRARGGAASFRRAKTSLLYLAPWITFGGSDKGTLDWLRHMDNDSYRLHVLTTQPSANELFGVAEELADEAWPLPDLMPHPKMPQFIMNFIATRNVDVLHVMNSRLGFDMLPAITAAYPHLRTVVQLHVEEEDCSGYCRYVATRYGNLIHAFSVTSEDLRHRICRYQISPSKVHVIYTGLDTRGEFDPDARAIVAPIPRRTDGGIDILFPARLTAQKDPLLMVRVAAALDAAGSSSTIHVVGEGELRRDVEEAVVAAGLTDRVLFHGPSYDMAKWYRATDVTLLTSRFEGMPFVIFEAMGMAQPVVVPDLGGTRELVDAEVGFLIRCQDRVEDYVGALLRLERDPQLRASLGLAARRRILERFTVEHMAEGHASLYRRLVSEHTVFGLLA